ncbi:MAG: mucoidy inhibitor MuiA family protein [Hyphomicrobiaceae bacterium]
MRIDVRVLAHAIVLVALTAAPLSAAEVPGTSAITTVTVFPRGAEVTRTAQLTVAQGDHILVFKDLPAQAIQGSIRVEGRSTGRLEIGSVDTRKVKVPRLDPATSQSERRKLELAIEKLDDERAVVNAEVKAAETQKAFIEALIALPNRPPAAASAQGEKREEWGDIFTLIGTRLAEAEKARLAATVKVREFDRRIADLEKALSGLAPVEDERTEVRVNVTAAAALEANLLVRYQVPSAAWHSLYDARLMTGGRNVAPSLILIRRAAIQQRTGEDWRDVMLSLSTTRPSSGASAPTLPPISVDYMPDPSKLRGVVSPSPSPTLATRSRHVAAESADRRDEADSEKAKSTDTPVEEQQASVETTPFQATFTLTGKMTVLTTGEVKRTQIDDAKVEPTIVVRAVPRLQTQAYLYAKVTMPKTTAFLPGPISLFRDGTYVGTGQLPLLSPGQEHEIGFGADDSVRVRHATVEDKRGETGLISSSQTDTRSFRITVKNLHERAIAISVLDQVPTSKQQDIKVELTGKTPPTRRDVDEKRGILAWETTLQPDEERQIDFGYRISWPAGKSVMYGR